jgi:hypothetical protein
MRRRGRADTLGVAVVVALTALVAAHRASFDGWLARNDVLTQYLPWYTYAGERLRALEVPGWNPHQFSGAPFAGDPQSGWLYLPVMLLFPFMSGVTAFKAMIAVQLAVAGLATYALARLLGIGVVGGVLAAVVFEFGPLLYHNTLCCTVRAQLAPWIPVALLGVEWALRARRRRDRLAPWFLTGLAISQMLAGWLGQGALNGLLVVAGYVAYRAVLSPPRGDRTVGSRVVDCLTTGAAVLALGLALGAAGLLPRLAVNAETNLAGGDYTGVEGFSGGPKTVAELLADVLADGPDHRAVAVGGVAIVLSLLAPVLARRRFAVPYFAALTVIVFVLSLDTTPLHRLFYLVPAFRNLHEHNPAHVTAVVMIGPAILSGATIESLATQQRRGLLVPIVAAPLLMVVLVAESLRNQGVVVGWPPLVAAAATTLLVGVVLGVNLGLTRGVAWGRFARLATPLIVAVAFVLPTGLEIAGSITGRGHHAGWDRHWDPAPRWALAVEAETATTDPGGAGEFLQTRLAENGPFRYVGYAGNGYPDEAGRRSYSGRRAEPAVLAILVNARPLALGLYEIQGYNPVQLQRYAEFILALNGEGQDYHWAHLRAAGVSSPLINLLNVRYVLVDLGLPPERADVAALIAGRREVFRNELVVVYENDDALPHAWIVHDVQTVGRGEALPLLSAGAIDPRLTALVEGEPPPVAPPAASGAESARVTRYEPEAIEIRVDATAPGLLVVSEVYASGWRAYVDGAEVEILPTDHVLRGVPIPAGPSVVELRYEPRSLRLGLAISALTTAAMLLVAVLYSARVRRPPSLHFARARTEIGVPFASGRSEIGVSGAEAQPHQTEEFLWSPVPRSPVRTGNRARPASRRSWRPASTSGTRPSVGTRR